MKCGICGACYITAIDGIISSVAKQHVREYAGRCRDHRNNRE